MPTPTFYNLSNEKKDKIIKSAKTEFSRVSINEVSIKNIVEDSGISRGSFYQYFESKEDLLDYLFESIGNVKEFLNEKMKCASISLFDFNKDIFDYLIDNLHNKENIEFAKSFFRNIKVSEINFLRMKKSKEKEEINFLSEEILSKMDVNCLIINSQEDLKCLNKMLFFVMRGSLATSLTFKTKEEAKKEYYKTLDLMRRAFEKKEGK